MEQSRILPFTVNLVNNTTACLKSMMCFRQCLFNSFLKHLPPIGVIHKPNNNWPSYFVDHSGLLVNFPPTCMSVVLNIYGAVIFSWYTKSQYLGSMTYPELPFEAGSLWKIGGYRNRHRHYFLKLHSTFFGHCLLIENHCTGLDGLLHFPWS